MPRRITERNWDLGETPLFLAGQPPRVSGFFEVRNRTGERRKLRQVSFSGLKLQTARGVRLGALRVFARVAPGERAEAPIRLRVDPHTPPGDYQCELDCGGERRAVTIHILESWKLSIVPGALSLKLNPGERAVRTVQIINLGNMPYVLHRAAFAPLQEKDGLHNAIFASVKKACAEGGQKTLDAFVRELGEREVGPATVKLKCAHRTLKPGESQLVELEFQLPDSLKKHRVYIGSLTLENARLRFDVEILDHARTAERTS